jgi:hypothetical protein
MLKSFVNLPDEEFELVFLDSYLKPEHEEDKMGILDVKVSTKTGLGLASISAIMPSNSARKGVDDKCDMARAS